MSTKESDTLSPVGRFDDSHEDGGDEKDNLREDSQAQDGEAPANLDKAEENAEVSARLKEIGDRIEEKKANDENGYLKKNRRKRALFCCLFFCLLFFLLILSFSFRIERQPAISIFEPPTGSPTSDSMSPTRAITPSPTISPVANPSTSAPFPLFPFPDVSELSCENIRLQENVSQGKLGRSNFADFNTASARNICGDTYAGADPLEPERSLWAVRRGRRDCPTRNLDKMNEVCTSVGARLCSLSELSDGVAQGTGCGGDRGFVWTKTQCSENDVLGFYMYDFGLRDSKTPAFKCERELQTLSVLRCCGDNF